MVKSDAYSTPERLAAYLEIPTPTGIQLTAMESLINAISSFIDSYTSLNFKQQTNTRLELETERGQTINLPYIPVVASQPFILERRNSQLNEDHWQTIDGLYYTVDMKAGILRFMDGVYIFRGRNIYRVTYTSGYAFDNVSTFLADTEAGDVELALWLIGKDMWLNKKTPANLAGEKLGDYSVTYQRPLLGVKSVMAFNNPEALAILDKYVDVSPLSVLTPLQSVG